MRKLFSLAAAGLIAATVATPAMAQMRTSRPTARPAAVAGVSVAAQPARILSAGGLAVAPRYLPSGAFEFGAAAGAALLPVAAGGARPLGLVAGSGNITDGFDWAALLSAESILGLRQRYSTGDNWSWGGAYLGRVNLNPVTMGVGEFGATWRNEFMYTMDTLDLFVQPDLSFFQVGGASDPRVALTLGFDWWATPGFALGANVQSIRHLGIVPVTGAQENRVSGGAKYLFTDSMYFYGNGLYLVDTQTTAVLAGVGLRL